MLRQSRQSRARRRTERTCGARGLARRTRSDGSCCELMCHGKLFIMTVLLVLGLFVVLAAAHNITQLSVPGYGDPRREASLACRYESAPGDPALHSVKWYRGNDEIFRYTPAQQPTTRTFNGTDGAGVVRDACDQRSCTIGVMLPRTYNTRLSFSCEVSTEGPRFAVVKQTKNLTVAVVLKESPVILGVPSSVQLGEEVLVNCTTAPAMPPANIMWFIDDKPERTEPWLVNNTRVSSADEHGLRSSWRALRVRVGANRGLVGLRCEATQPTWPPYIRAANASLVIARSPHLSMFTASGVGPTVYGNVLLVAVCSVYALCRRGALSAVARHWPFFHSLARHRPGDGTATRRRGPGVGASFFH